MAVQIGNPMTVTQKETIARVELFTDAKSNPDDWTLFCHFETGLYDADGKLIGDTQFGTRVIRRAFGDIKNQPGIAALVEEIKSNCYQYRDEDIETEEAAKIAREQLE